MYFIDSLKELTFGPAFYLETLREKRYNPRLKCNIKASADIEGAKQRLTVINVSFKGVKIESALKLKKDAAFNLRVESETGTLSDGEFSNDTLRVQVAWCRKEHNRNNYTAGLFFIDGADKINDSWVSYIFSMFNFDIHKMKQKRKSFRIPTQIDVLCRSSSGPGEQGVLQDIGLGGALVTCGREFPKGDILKLFIGPYENIRQFTLKGKVIRASFLEKSHQFLTALEFTHLSNIECKDLGRFMMTLIRSSLGRQL